MQETLNFLTIIDDKIKKNNHLSDARKHHNYSTRDKFNKRNQRYPYAKAIDFRQSKYNSDYPRWLTEKQGFSEFMYKSYQKKLMSIPKICQKASRESDQKYFIALFLQKIDIFRRIPNEVIEIILESLQTKYYKAGETVHKDIHQPQFMGIIYIGSVEYKNGKKNIVREKNDIILKDSFTGHPHPTIVCKQETIILALKATLWKKINQTVRRQTQTKERDLINDLLKSTFFSQLHLKDKRAKQFYDAFSYECYFKDQIIQQAGNDEKAFYFIYKGTLQEQNHIYVREHNKWPMPHRRWEVRAVYNSYQQNRFIKQFDFFGDQEMMENLKFKAKYVATSWTVLLKMSQEDFYKNLNHEDVKRLKKFRAENADVNYTDFESQVRNRAQSTKEKKKIILKAINTSLNHKSEFSPKKLSLIDSYEKSMLRRALVGDKTISF